MKDATLQKTTEFGFYLMTLHGLLNKPDCDLSKPDNIQNLIGEFMSLLTELITEEFDEREVGPKEIEEYLDQCRKNFDAWLEEALKKLNTEELH